MKFRKTQTIRLVIADDHLVLRDCLRRLVEREADIKVVGEATNGGEAVKLARELKPDILTTCMAKPDMSGLDVLRKLNGTWVRVVMWTAHTRRIDVLNALKLGARGYVFKPVQDSSILLKAIRTVMAGEYWVHRESFSNRDLALFAVNQGLPLNEGPPAALENWQGRLASVQWLETLYKLQDPRNSAT